MFQGNTTTMAPTIAATIVRRSIPVVQSVFGQRSEHEPAEQCADDPGDKAADHAVALVTGDDTARDEAGNGADDQPSDDAHNDALF